jgi:guanylate kinase
MPDESISFDFYHPQPVLIVLSGPSGVGKDAVLQSLRRRCYPIHIVVTATSRPPRSDEINGVDYIFVSQARFEEMIANDELLEHALVYNQYKGIPKSQVREALSSGKDVIMRVDVQGAARIRSLCPDAVMIFLLPSNAAEWFKRLHERKSETEESLKLRIDTARSELEQLHLFDYVVVNAEDQLEKAVETIIAIIDAEHHRIPPRKITL